jgi:VWFA-related protein
MTLRSIAILIFSLAFLSPPRQAGRPAESPPQSNSSAASDAPSLIRRSEDERRGASLLSHEVVLNVFVTDAAGKPVRGLTEENFTILDDGQARQIAFFRPAQPPHVVLLLDAVNSPRWSYTAECRAAEKFLAGSSAPLRAPMAIAWLANSGIYVNPESQDPKTLLDQLRAASAVPTGPDSADPTASKRTAVLTANSPTASTYQEKTGRSANDQNRRFVLSVNALIRFALKQENIPGRIVVLWLGPGWPLLTGPGFLEDTAEMKSGFFDRIADLTNDFEDAQITLNAIASPDLLRESNLDNGYYAPFLGAVTGPLHANAANLALPVLAVHSGGQVLDQKNDMASAIAASLAGIHSWYMLAFQSRPSAQPDEYRPLQVTVTRPGAVVRTITGYYAEP